PHLLPAGAPAARFATKSQPSRSRCSIATVAIVSERPALRFPRLSMSRPRHSQSRKAHHGIIRHPANPVATTSAAFARTAVLGFLAALVIKDAGSTLRAWTIQPYLNRRCIYGQPTRSPGTKSIRIFRSARSMHRDNEQIV